MHPGTLYVLRDPPSDASEQRPLILRVHERLSAQLLSRQRLIEAPFQPGGKGVVAERPARALRRADVPAALAILERAGRGT